MREKTRWLTKAAAVAALACGLLVSLTGTPALAATVTKCSGEQHKSFPTPGNDTDVYITVCIHTISTYERLAWYYLSWKDGGDSDVDDDRKFDKFTVQIRIERYDSVQNDISQSLRASINTHSTGTYDYTGYGAGYTDTDRLGGWTADATVTYNIDRDGEGDYKWQLTGSPQVT